MMIKVQWDGKCTFSKTSSMHINHIAKWIWLGFNALTTEDNVHVYCEWIWIFSKLSLCSICILHPKSFVFLILFSVYNSLVFHCRRYFDAAFVCYYLKQTTMIFNDLCVCVGLLVLSNSVQTHRINKYALKWNGDVLRLPTYSIWHSQTTRISMKISIEHLSFIVL